MATLREIKQRIVSIKNTQKITKAMKMVAAAKMRRAQERMFSARPYASKIKELAQNLAANAEESRSPFLKERTVSRTSLLLVTADRGLCGAFNSNSIKKTISVYGSLKDQDVSLVCIGKKGGDFFSKRDFEVERNFSNIFTNLQYIHADQIAQPFIDDYIGGKIDAVKIIYNEFKSVAKQNLVVQDLLPVKLEEADQADLCADYIYEPSQEAILDAVIPRYLKVQIWQALLESFAAEQAARMMAMENATDNAGELISKLTLQYNKARQASITKEILEIVGGAEALKSA